MKKNNNSTVIGGICFFFALIFFGFIFSEKGTYGVANFDYGCAPGNYEIDDYECIECPPNSYCPGNLVWGEAVKYDCPVNSISESGSESIEDCKCVTGYTWDAASETCIKDPEPSSPSSSSSEPSSSNPPSSESSSSNVQKIEPIYSISLDSTSLCISESTELKFSASVAGNVVVSSSAPNIITVSSPVVDVSAGKVVKISLDGVNSGKGTVEVEFTPSDTSKYNSITKSYTLTVLKSCDGENVDKNPPTSNIMLFIVWSIGLAVLGYSFWYFKTNKYN